ncbi:hypothetical protein [Micromonospora olivasterospora]|uniref:Uncharacterized protein n=1 Tax=Micromonospora olivasterospora TaxID=1880 RepID=A0A562IGP2_MICOL|nr:hypothetical protein [Micromonospora olivasterospora]TWH69923.1 hypothetical protein JD77_04940 [Micromonospora olivasterospora]
MLGRRTLPWERRLADGTPWLALLVVRADEGKIVDGTLQGLVGSGVVAALAANQPVDPNRPVRGLQIKDLATFRALLPGRADVALLTHVRRVNLADTALAGADDDGWFSVVTANRLPLAGSGPTSWTACLVSLEAREDAWSTTTGTPPTLVVLASWKFVTSSTGGTFERLAADLDVAAFGEPAAGAAPVLRPDGVVPLAGTARDGGPTAVGYRPPLLGPGTGATDDVTDAAAYELGRLLAAADGRFIREVVGWHRAAEATARSADTAARRATVVRDYLAGGARAQARRAALAGETAETLGYAPADVPETDGRQPQPLLAQALADRLFARTGQADLWQAPPQAAEAARTISSEEGERS